MNTITTRLMIALSLMAAAVPVASAMQQASQTPQGSILRYNPESPVDGETGNVDEDDENNDQIDTGTDTTANTRRNDYATLSARLNQWNREIDQQLAQQQQAPRQPRPRGATRRLFN